ncbi:putative ABC transporter-associated repeat protein [Rothia dentocariosa]|uniref:Putative ABC transporter-associated repeat protein n=1 Tax=Rothia dentocariosa TaxID=2047 RepID=A0A3S4YTQ4_9MICC|nr:putative ABC transporter-associated repeat protein [Rothia dentocariosa]
MRRSAPQIPPREQRSRKTFTIIGTTALGCTLALSPALPAFNTAPAALAHEEHSAGTAQAEPRSYTGNYIVRGVHTELLNAELHNGKLALNSKAETQDGEGLFNPSTTVFNLPANDQSQTRVAAGYDFIAPEGTPIWYIPQKHTDGLLYPGFSAENIPQGALKNNKITVDLIKSEVPEGARAEVFQENLSGASRMFSTADRLAPYELEAGSHVHAAWAFTAAGTYRFTFRTSTELADGTQVHAETTYTVVVGEVPQDIFEQGHRAQNPQDSAESAAAPPQHEEGGEQAHRDAAPNERSSEEDHGAGNSRAQHQVIEPAHQDSSSVEAAPAQPDSSADAAPNPQIATGDAPAPDAPAPAPQQAGQNAGAPNHTVNGSNAQNVTAPTVRGAGSGGSGASGNTAPSSGSRGGSYPGTESEKCIPTEVVVKDSVQSRSTQSPANIPGTLPMVTTADHAAADRATEGHFDVGPVLNGSTLSSAVKDDRFSPPKHVSPGSLEFVLGDAAKLKFPAGMEDIAPREVPCT